MVYQNSEFGKVLVLPNGGGTVTFFNGEWDESLRGDIFNQFRDVSKDVLDLMIETFEQDGPEEAWAVYHKATS